MFENITLNFSGGLEKVISDLYEVAKTEAKKKIREKLALIKIEELKDNVYKVGQVRTILQPDNTVNIKNIYSSEIIRFHSKDHIMFFNQFKKNKVLVEGGPGQGKSIYLKYLSLNEAKNGDQIPIFIEFRNLSFEKSLKEEIMQSILDYGIEIDKAVFNYLAKSKKLLLILDGFDEVPTNKRLKCARELEQLCKNHKELKIIVSSRPDAGLGSSAYFEKFVILPLTLDIQLSFLKFIYKIQEEYDSISNVLIGNKYLIEITQSPLLLILFSITYRARQFKPDSISEFYSIIFPTMLYRHDRMKIGFERPRASKLSDYQMQRIFEIFSFISLKYGQVTFSTLTFREHIEKALEYEKINGHIEDEVIEDITLITNLILRDGYDNYSFSHKSVQEYFASSFFIRSSDEAKQKFYTHLVDNYEEYRKWQNVLTFLSTTDSLAYLKYYLLPIKKQTLNIDDTGDIQLNYQSLVTTIGDMTKMKVDEDGELLKLYWDDTYSSSIFKNFAKLVRAEVHKYIISQNDLLAEYIEFCDLEDYERYKIETNHFIINVVNFIVRSSLQNNIVVSISGSLSKSSIMTEIYALEKQISKTEILNDDILAFE